LIVNGGLLGTFEVRLVVMTHWVLRNNLLALSSLTLPQVRRVGAYCTNGR